MTTNYPSTASSAVAETMGLNGENYDFYWKLGMPLRPIPPGKDQFGELWFDFRKRVFGDWFEVEPTVAPTDETRMFDDHLWQGDELMDAVVDMFARTGKERGRALFEQALADGIGSIPDAPPELAALFAKYEAKPEWYDPIRGRRGQRRMTSASMAGQVSVIGFAVFDTLMNTDVSATTGATGRFRTDPLGRFAESARYAMGVLTKEAAQPGRGSDIYAVAMRVRLMHALVRAGLKSKWGAEHYRTYGMPLSNSSMCGFMEGFLLYLLMDHAFGRPCTQAELEDAWHFTRYWMYIAGVADELIPTHALAAMRNLDYLVARDAGPSEWRPQMVESLLGEDATALPAIQRKVMLWTTGAVGAAMFGDTLTTTLFEGTSLENFDHARAGRTLQRVAIPITRFAALRDRTPVLRSLRGRGISAPDLFNSLTFARSLKKASKAGVSTDFTSHDGNHSGQSFGRSKL